MKRPGFFPSRDYVCNYVINRIPVHDVRMRAYGRIGMQLGENATLLMSVEVHAAPEIRIGGNTTINRHCFLDGRGGLTIGDNVNVSSHALLVTGSHEVQDGERFTGFVRPITIEDYVWLCTRCTILPGVTIGKGAVVAAGAVVTKSVEPYHIVAGIPARTIGHRNEDLHYTLGAYNVPWQ